MIRLHSIEDGNHCSAWKSFRGRKGISALPSLIATGYGRNCERSKQVELRWKGISLARSILNVPSFCGRRSRSSVNLGGRGLRLSTVARKCSSKC
ncbi:MAG: hypothetical protein ACTS6G_03770 [Candidatus Hodgkinia cicadicola]